MGFGFCEGSRRRKSVAGRRIAPSNRKKIVLKISLLQMRTATGHRLCTYVFNKRIARDGFCEGDVFATSQVRRRPSHRTVESQKIVLKIIYTYKRAVCVCWFVCLLFIGHTTFVHLRRCLRVLREQPSRRGRPRARAGKLQAHAQREHARAYRTTSQRKIAALMPFKNKSVRARACCRIRNCRDFHKKGERKPTCHFPSSVYSLPSLGVFTFRIVRIVLDLWSEPTLVSCSVIYTYKRVVCVCWFVCLLFIGHTTFVHFAALPPRAGEQEPSRAAPRAQASACTAPRSRARARIPYNFSTKKSLRWCLSKTKPYARMLSYT